MSDMDVPFGPEYLLNSHFSVLFLDISINANCKEKLLWLRLGIEPNQCFSEETLSFALEQQEMDLGGRPSPKHTQAHAQEYRMLQLKVEHLRKKNLWGALLENGCKGNCFPRLYCGNCFSRFSHDIAWMTKATSQVTSSRHPHDTFEGTQMWEWGGYEGLGQGYRKFSQLGSVQ